MTSLFRALAGASLLAFTHPALAAADDSAEDSRSIIVTGQKAIEEAQAQAARTPGGTDIVAADAYQDKAAVSLRDALAFSPGVYTQPRFGQEVRLSIRGSGLSRGFHMRGLTLLQDGIPINLADNNGDFQELDPTIFQHLEVYRGANALRLGSSTLGGAINGVTPTGRTAPGVTLRVDGGSFGTVRGVATMGYADDKADVWVAVAGDSSSGDREHADRRALRFNGNVGLRLSDRVETRLYTSAQTIDQDLPGALDLATVLTRPKTGNFVNDQERDIQSLRLQNRTRLLLGEQGTLDVGIFINQKALFHPIFQVIDQDSTDYGIYGRYEQDWERVGLTLGGTSRWGRVNALQYRNLNGDRVGAPLANALQKARTTELYGEVRVAPVERLWLIAGGVYVDGRRSVDNRINPRASDARSFSEFAPKFGLLFDATPAIQLYANYSRSAELPGFSELAAAQPDPGFVPLKAQTAWTTEIGTRGKAGMLQWDVSLYRADLKNELLQFSVIPGIIPAATFNADRTRHQGIEAGLDLTLAPWATLRQVYTLSDFTFRDDAVYADNRLPVIATHLYRAELKLGTESLAIAPNLEWVPRAAYADYVNSVRPDGYVLIGLTAHAQVMPGVTLFADARNLTGRRAVGDISAVVRVTPNANPALPSTQALYYPVERRALSLGVRALF
ncbi:TonB-dependent receptor family protein [Sphingobium algorifonticola]|uniref:TonB-dependent receptor n=1 Tax=Sphingobium algorifonticola TaxID=2008318 RepID=A0A437JCN1_9SPHN|nr:TonB-dependent receptor [Sphingobium algorifonticola]RVT43688.1 TonB-dependent receptor [Sphingobium algorifonticola]